MEGKYIIVKLLDHEVPILFSSLIDHSHFLEMYPSRRIVSAGFFELHPYPADCKHHTVSTWGDSTSLGNIQSRPEDVGIVEKFLND